MNSALTRPQSLQELYKTYFSFANRFKFTDLLRNYVQNEEWKDKSQQNVWDLLSRISDDIGAVLTDDIVNYTRNVVDINTCKVPQLIEQAWMLSYKLDHLKNSYAFLPRRIQCLVDLFSINPEYLIGNSKNHILSDDVIKEILIYIRDNVHDKRVFITNDVIDKLLDDPHLLLNQKIYRDFIVVLFYTSIVEALSATYSTVDDKKGDKTPIAFNLLWNERKNGENILSRVDEYKSWVDKYIWNEIEYPLNDSGLDNTIYKTIETVKSQKRISPKFNPFKIADHIYFNGLNPNNQLSDDEMDLVERVIAYHAKTRYDYQNHVFVDDPSTQYAYYRELEWCEYIKLVMFVMNNINSFRMENLTYDQGFNKFIHLGMNQKNCIRVVKLFNQDSYIVENSNGGVALDHSMIMDVAEFLCQYTEHIQGIRENIKTIAQKHAMRGTGALLVHIVNDYLVKELPIIRDMMYYGSDDEKIRFMWEIDPDNFRNYGNVKLLEYEDDNEYFNIDPFEDVRFTKYTNARYWEKLEGMSDNDTLGVLTKGQIKDFYRNVLGMGKLQPDKPRDYDDIVDFLVDLFKIGANPIKWDSNEKEFNNPIDDIINMSEEDYGYTKEERLAVQNNSQLRQNQEDQFKAYTGNENIIGDSIYDLVNNKIFYWKNTDYSSHVLHPFMYNLKLWNKLNNIIINGYKDYVNTDLIEYLSSKVKFDEIFGKFGESRNFWKYNVMDLTGYTTRYEAAIKDEHLDDFNNTVSPLTGYDGLFYPDAAGEFLKLFGESQDFTLTEGFFKHTVSRKVVDENGDEIPTEHVFIKGSEDFLAAIYSIYWQEQRTVFASESDGKLHLDSDEPYSFYTKWYSHLNYTRSEYQKIAMQLWYWRDRIKELISIEYPMTRYCLDIQGNSLMLVETFKPDDESTNPYLVDLEIEQNRVQQEKSGNRNEHVSFCDNKLVKPSELWIRWKSNPIAVPAFDVYYDENTGDEWFDYHYRNGKSIEFGQVTHTNSECNDEFKVVLSKWRNQYGLVVNGNKLPVFFDMEQSAHVLTLSSWNLVTDYDEDGIAKQGIDGKEKKVGCCAKNPLHIVSMEKTGSLLSDYTYRKYATIQENQTSELYHKWLFDRYHYCQANGSILIPFYRFDCQDYGEVGDKIDYPRQVLHLRMFVIAAQQMKQDNNVVTERVAQLEDVDIDLNARLDFDEGSRKFRFDHPIKVCRNTNLVFSAYDSNGLNKVRCAFLGQYAKEDSGIFCQAEEDRERENYRQTSIKKSSCGAETRYEFDSQSETDMALTKGRYFQKNDDVWIDGETQVRGRYIDSDISNDAFNSYDSNDKFVFVVDLAASIDNKRMFDISWMNGIDAHSYNILGDAGYIPHFAYQSLIRYSDKDGGIAYTWKNNYLEPKNHMQFELLGLDDKKIPDAFKAMQKMVVDDLTDKCKTLLCPAKLMEDIYRIWCETTGVKRKLYPGEEDPYGYKQKYESYFPNEYVDYSNPTLDFSNATVRNDGSRVLVWDVCSDQDNQMFELELPMEEQQSDQETGDEVFKSLLDEYYVSVVRTSNGNILNEKRYILPPTSLSQFLFEAGDGEGFVECNLIPHQTALVQDNHFVKTQVVFTGTQNPFNYDENGNRVYSRPEALQYGNGVPGVDSMQLKVDIISEPNSTILKRDKAGNIVVESETVQKDPETGNGKIVAVPGRKTVIRRLIKPTVRFVKSQMGDQTLEGRIHDETNIINAGDVTVIFSHKNLDNIAKYHILNKSSNLYFDGSLPKNGENQFKFSDFKFSRTVRLDECSPGEWKSRELDDNGYPLVHFTNVKSANNDGLPPYYVEIDMEVDGETVHEKWFLEQDGLVPSGRVHEFKFHEKEPLMEECGEQNCHVSMKDNGVDYPIPTTGSFKWAHKVKSKPEKYLDYLYISKGSLAFKISEESESFADLMSKIPPFYIDEVTKNKLMDLNDVQILKEYSTFIHQSERPDGVKECANFNPLVVNAVLKYGIEQKELYNVDAYVDGTNIPTSISVDQNPKMICTEDKRLIELNNSANPTTLKLQLEDGEVDDYLKIYTNFVRVDDDFGDFHYDLYFNIQNLFHSPFEYISSVTNQANVLILPDSYLYLPGDKYKKGYDGNGKWTHNEIDKEKVDAIKRGDTLTIYGQVKTYSDDILSSVRTIKLFSYQIWNISDDKPKFLIEKTYDITKSRIQDELVNTIGIKFSDVMWTLDESQFKWYQGPVQTSANSDTFRELNQDVVVVQPVSIRYNWNGDDDYRVNQISFDIVNDVIDFANIPRLCDYWMQARTLRNGEYDSMDGVDVPVKDKAYYDHWSDKYMKLEVDEDTGIPRLTLKYMNPDGFNFDTIYLKWLLPSGCRIMDTIDRLGGYIFSSTAQNIQVEQNNSYVTQLFDVTLGHVTARVHKPGEMYLGQEHSTKMRKNGYVLTGLASAIYEALLAGETNPTLRNFTISEKEIMLEARSEMDK